ncbi:MULTISPECIES: molecular chaperone TorD family protein [unclassified Shewanella]|uniref:TorD/DmsD family molecular chaperone n=1 Tax=unclassified Shewanella TaxID=196818 RepID=UPI000C8612F9|nr:MULTISPECIES: molecular chaperone TorD family protein [unclassified Shewanella]MDO6678068.1 molecular chaperone TorD family protein [Shewanella sp. 4_MG-2023]MDO6775061.1 molecular chaperone TorD family protein [Shewanella sp. 3_MG-2023]PMG30464.1 hypothetical protein BCU94_10670 [Shewanella sp. 10N.286.52.C2]PMG49601.1 hypothetical protein BCU91_02720 [Shewanella sp. 10N.286.52.B9]
MNQVDFENSAAICNVLSCMLLNTPTENMYQRINDEIILNWPQLITPTEDICDEMKRSLNKHSFTELRNDFNQLFVGPGVKSAYPWGSVYTDKDNLVCGQSCVEFEQFCKRNKIDVTPPQKGPSDHIGLILAVLANLLSENRSDLASMLICDHLKPWLPQFIRCVDTHSQTEFYRGVGLLIGITLNDLQIKLQTENS